MVLEPVDIEDLRMRTPDNYFDGRKCCKCGSDKNVNRRYYDENGDWDGKSYLCHKCRMKEYVGETRKPLMKSRNRNLPIDCSTAKGIIGEAIFIKRRGAKSCNVIKDNLSLEYDCFDNEYGKTQVKIRGLVKVHRINRSENRWCFSNIRPENYHVIVLFCTDVLWRHIERIYIIPTDRISGISITIYEKLLSRYSKWEEFRINDIKSYDDIYQNLISYIGNKKFIDIDDIERWLKEGDLNDESDTANSEYSG